MAMDSTKAQNGSSTKAQNGSSTKLQNSSSTKAQNGSSHNGVPATKLPRADRDSVERGERWVVRASRESHDCVNPVRSCVENYFDEPMEKRDQSKDLIRLSIGDPSVFGNLPPPPAAYEGVQQAVTSTEYNGYAHSCGIPETREAVAKHFSTKEAPLTAGDIVMTNAGSGALLLSLEALCDPGSTVLIPTPGFSLYQCHAEARGVQIKMYRLLPERRWEIDLAHLESLMDGTVTAMIVNNPSNPCGSVYSRQHLLDLLRVAERHRCPIISDDIYQDMVFPGQEYVPLPSLSKNVPILSCGGISKRYMVPGWRLGWILIHDRNGTFKDEVTPGLRRLAMKLLGPCTLVQAALPHIFDHTPQSYHDRNMRIVQRNAELVYEGLSRAPGLTPVMPAGSMYMMVVIDLARFPNFETDLAFTKQLLMEESVFCLPGNAFNATGCFRVVLMMPDNKIEEALQRIQQFCTKHYIT